MSQRSYNQWPFFLWLSVFYAAWLALVLSGNHWGAMLERRQRDYPPRSGL